MGKNLVSISIVIRGLGKQKEGHGSYFSESKKEKQAKCTRNRHAIEHMHVMFHPALDDTISYLVKGDTWT